MLIENFPLAAIEDDKKPFTSDSHAYQYVSLVTFGFSGFTDMFDRPFSSSGYIWSDGVSFIVAAQNDRSKNESNSGNFTRF